PCSPPGWLWIICRTLATSGLELEPPLKLLIAWLSRLSSNPISNSLKKNSLLEDICAETTGGDPGARFYFKMNLLLLRDDLVLDFVVSCLRKNLLPHQVGLLRIRPTINNFL